MRADVADEELFFRALQDVIVLDASADRLQIDESFFGGALVGILEYIQLELGRCFSNEVFLRCARNLFAQNASGCERNELSAILVIDVAEHERSLVVPGGDAQRVEIGNGPEISV